MYPAIIVDPEIRAFGGEPLEGSGFETEDPATGLDSYQQFAEEGLNQ